MSRKTALYLSAVLFLLLLIPGFFAPENLPPSSGSLGYLSPGAAPPLGTDELGRPLLAYALQGAQIVALPSLLAALLVLLLGTVAGLLACTGQRKLETLVQGLGEIVGSLPRFLVVLVVALVLAGGMQVGQQATLLPIALTWGLLSAPGAMDEAGAVSARLGGARFVEALRAHGFSRTRIYLFHIVGLNLRPVVVRHAAETLMQVVFLEISLSYLCTLPPQPASLTHGDSLHSWAELLQMGYRCVIDPVRSPSLHALLLGLGLLGLVVGLSFSLRVASRAR